jgi:hypothetical protein
MEKKIKCGGKNKQKDQPWDWMTYILQYYYWPFIIKILNFIKLLS